MPPEEEPRPSEKEISTFIAQLDQKLSEGKAARMAARPPVAHYRLSRKEYQNTVYDLLGVRYDPAKPGELNADPLWHGFERIGSQLTLSPPMLKDITRRLRRFCPVPSPLKAFHLKSFARPQRISVTGVRTSTRKPSNVLESKGLFDPSFCPAGCNRHSDIIGLVAPAPNIADSTGQKCR